MPFRKIPGAMAQEFKVMGLDTDVREDVKKAGASAHGKYLTVAFLISSYWCRYKDLTVALKKDYAMKQKQSQDHHGDVQADGDVRTYEGAR